MIRGSLNTAAGSKWSEWNVPLEVEPKWTALMRAAHTGFWNARKEKQAEIDGAIARSADFETLFDQPYEDNKRLRVSGPFTVESLSPHRMLPADENGDGVVSRPEAKNRDDFVRMLIDNLRRAGVQNTKKNERLKFDRLDVHAGTWLQASGEYQDGEGILRQVRVAFGPEFGTVGLDLIKDAAKEAMKGGGCDLLLVCGFAFEPSVNEEARNYGALTVLPVKMNFDLMMGDELLKKTGAGNLFMVFGSPDVTLTAKNGDVTVELKGLDIYDPTTGQVRASSIDDIAAWFIDTDYNEESFFVRHAYFTGADKPFEKLRKALKADVNETAWASLYATKSRPFPKPAKGKIAVKVINHYGDEVMQVYPV